MVKDEALIAGQSQFNPSLGNTATVADLRRNNQAEKSKHDSEATHTTALGSATSAGIAVSVASELKSKLQLSLDTALLEKQRKIASEDFLAAATAKQREHAARKALTALAGVGPLAAAQQLQEQKARAIAAEDFQLARGLKDALGLLAACAGDAAKAFEGMRGSLSGDCDSC